MRRRAPRGNPGPLRIAFTRAIQDWYYDLIPFAVMNLVWLIMVVTVIAGPPATAAMLCVARDTATGQGGEPGRFFYLFASVLLEGLAAGSRHLSG